MFTYICPKCGREVPPAYTDCPDCAAKEAGIIAPPLVEREPKREPALPVSPEPEAARSNEPAPLPRTEPSPAPAQSAAQVAPSDAHEAAAVSPLGSTPMWLLAVLFAFAFLGVVLGGYWLVNALRGGSHQATATTAQAPASNAAAAANPLMRYIEVSGVRYAEDPKDKDKTIVKFVLTNHSDADLPGVSGTVTLLGKTPQTTITEGTFSFTTDLPPGAVKDMSAPLDTKKMIYELPDWQNAATDLQITAPGTGSAGSPARR